MGTINHTTIRNSVNHLKHCIEEEHKISLSDKVIRDIWQTIEAANHEARIGPMANIKELEDRLYKKEEAYS